MNKPNISGGLYLVADPSMEKPQLLENIQQALEGGVNIIQVWNNWPEAMGRDEKEELFKDIISATDTRSAPVLVNEEWQLLKTTGLDGVHFDNIPEDFDRVKKEIARDFLCGITCENDLEIVAWAEANGLDYLSFCSMFPSVSAGSCEIVRPETVKKAREMTSLPLFLSGGISTENMQKLEELEYDGVAVISGILNADSPRHAASEYNQALQKRTFIE